MSLGPVLPYRPATVAVWLILLLIYAKVRENSSLGFQWDLSRAARGAADAVEKSLVAYLESIDEKYSRVFYNVTQFDYAEALGEEVDIEAQEIAESNFAEFAEEVQDHLRTKYGFWRQLKNPDLRREMKEWFKEGTGNFSNDDAARLDDISTAMREGYAKAAVCPYKSAGCDCDAEEPVHCTMTLNPEIEEILETSRDPEELKYYWLAWHDSVSKHVTAEQYFEFLALKNKQYRALGYNGNSDFWASEYDTGKPDWDPSSYRVGVNKIRDMILPLYKILHAYVRMKLSQYPPYKGLIKRCAYIPNHLVGNMFGQTWTAIDSITKPHPAVPSLDATEEMRRQNYTVEKMIKLAEDAFKGMGLEPLPPAFWKYSVLHKRPGMTCHPTAWDMGLGRVGMDYRVTMCAQVTQKDLATMHHELGHVQVMIQTRKLRYAQRGPPNPAFDESIGDVLAMAVNTPEHLQCVLGLDLGVKGLCDPGKKDYTMSATDMNYLYIQALDLFAFLPFAFVMDAYRDSLLNMRVDVDWYQKNWWSVREGIQGIKAPEKRPLTAFDPAAKFHIIVHQSYFRYFLSTIVQFQLYEGLCKAAGQYNPADPNGKPLYRCDFLGSKKAGKLFGDMLKLGRSAPWPEALKKVTGMDRFSAEPLIRYFEPLFNKLKELLKEGGEYDCLFTAWDDAERRN